MSFPQFVMALMDLGLRLEAEGEHLRCAAPEGLLDSGTWERVRQAKSGILSAARDRDRARALWREALQEIARAWNRLHAQCGVRPSEEDQRDDELEPQIGEAIRTAKLDCAVRLIERWRVSWLERIREIAKREERQRELVGGRRLGPGTRTRRREFDQRTLRLRSALERLVDSGEIDRVKPFQLRRGVRVPEPRKMAEALLSDLESADSPRSRHGVAQQDLKDLLEHLTGGETA